MLDRAEATWAEMVRRHAERAPADLESAGYPEHRPLAAVLACSDARVPPSVVFDQKPGSLFVVRLAGNSATPSAIASLTYAVEQLATELVVVLGHTGCGAVGAALAAAPDDRRASALNPILTPIDEMLAACADCADSEAAVFANVRHNVGRLRRDRGALGHAIERGDVSVRGAVHDLLTGRLLDAVSATTPTEQPPHPPHTTQTLTRSTP